MARVPEETPPSRAWNDDTRTAIFGDDLLEDYSPLPEDGSDRAPSLPPSMVPVPDALASSSNSSMSPGRRDPMLPPPGADATFNVTSGWNGRSYSSAPATLPSAELEGRARLESSNSTRPDSGLDTLRPYVGSQPQIHVARPGRLNQPKKASRLYIVRGFTWGIALASLLFSAGVIHYRDVGTNLESVDAAAPRFVDADQIAQVRQKKLYESASEGEKDALERLRKKPASSRTPEEVKAIFRGEEARARLHAQAVVEALAKQTTFTEADEAEFMSHAGSQRTFREALVAMSANKSEAGPDLIYGVMRHFRHQKDIYEFARALLITPQVYKYASPALTVIIDAEMVTECSEVKALVERVEEHGDTRAIRHMAKFAKTTGCGEHGIHDCYPCLRGDRGLVDALRAAQDRPAPD